LSGWDWVWVLLGVGLDVMKWGQILNKRREVPGYPSGNEPAIPQTAYEAEVPGSPMPDTSETPDSESGVSQTDAELEKLTDLRDKGVLTDEEFEQKKKQLTG
jgi:hypothetical protein